MARADQILETLSKLNEAKKFPTQDNAEVLADWFNSMRDVSDGPGGRGSEIGKALEKADKIRIKLHQKIFGEKSPWNSEFKKGKMVIFWDKVKAKSLGL